MTKPVRASGQNSFVALQELFKASNGAVVNVENTSVVTPRQPVRSAMDKLKAQTNAALMRQRGELDGRILQTVLPMWDDDNRGVPNPIIRSGLFGVGNTVAREFMQKMPIASLSNYAISYTGQDLQQDDLSVWMSLINLARNQPMSDSILFTGYALVKDLGWRMHSESYKRAQESIERLKVTGIEISTNNRETAYSGSLIREYAWTAKDAKGNARWMVSFEPRVSALFMEDTTTLLEWETRKKIGSRATVAQWLHAFYSSHRDPIPLRVDKLHELCRSVDSLSSFKRNLGNALQKLVVVEFLTTFSIVDNVVYIKKKLRAKQIQRADQKIKTIAA
jgi:TrfA protein